MAKTALVAGGTGLVGRSLLEQLFAAPGYGAVIALGRRAPDVSHAKLEFVETDFEDLDRLGVSLAANDVFCCLGTTRRKARSCEAFHRVDHEFPLALAKAAHAQGAQQFLVVSSIGASSDALSFYLRTKGELEQALGKVGFTSVIVLRPSMLLGARGEVRLMEWLGKVAILLARPFLLGSLGKYRPIHADTVARAMITLARMGLYGEHVVESDRIDSMGR